MAAPPPMKISHSPLEGRFVRLAPLAPELRSSLRAALDTDPDAWAMMVTNGGGEGFDGWWAEAERERAAGTRLPYAVVRRADGAVVGTTSLTALRPAHRGAEIGSTFYRPDARGGAVNPECKRLLLAHAFDGGAIRVELITDALNARSRAAIAKLGAVEEGVLRAHKVTWTGRVRDTAVFSITAAEWPAVRDRLDARIAAALA